jgi:exopolysaccharide biosynthesis protein
MTHQWIAYLFYGEDTINAVMASNKVEEIIEDTDTNAIVVGVQTNKYENEYEQAVLEKENASDTYKIIEISGKGYSGYLAVIYDPSKIQTLVTAKIGTSGQYLTTMAKNSKAVVAINGGGFDDPDYSSNAANPLGVTYSKGKLITSYYYAGAGGIIGFDSNDKLVLSSKCTAESAKALKIRDAVTCGPFLIVNGKASTVVGNGGWGKAPRTVIGQRKDGIVLFLVLDGRTATRPGADMDDLIEIMQNYGAYNAANLDGGTSSGMAVNYELINDPIDSTGAHKTRFVSTGFGLIE